MGTHSQGLEADLGAQASMGTISRLMQRGIRVRSLNLKVPVSHSIPGLLTYARTADAGVGYSGYFLQCIIPNGVMKRGPCVLSSWIIYYFCVCKAKCRSPFGNTALAIP